MTYSKDRYLQLIESPRVSPQTRDALIARLIADDPNYEPTAVTPNQLEVLRHLLARVIPQESSESAVNIDLAARLDKQLAEAKGDGWRYATLPGDVDAYRVGLSMLDEFAVTLSAVPFARLPAAAQDSLLDAIASGRLLSAKLDLKRWFEDVRADATQIYVSHPQTLARMGYSGIADDPDGFMQLGIGERETWEPEAQ